MSAHLGTAGARAGLREWRSRGEREREPAPRRQNVGGPDDRREHGGRWTKRQGELRCGEREWRRRTAVAEACAPVLARLVRPGLLISRLGVPALPVTVRRAGRGHRGARRRHVRQHRARRMHGASVEDRQIGRHRSDPQREPAGEDSLPAANGPDGHDEQRTRRRHECPAPSVRRAVYFSTIRLALTGLLLGCVRSVQVPISCVRILE